jgi:HAE1 family hydrophobic/amphiphilic exporter-1
MAGGGLLGAGWAATARAQAPAAAPTAAFIAATAATAVAAAPAAAAPETLRLTLPEVARLARERDRGVLQAREYQAWVRGKYVEERAGALPVIRLEASAARQRDESQQALFGGLFPPQQDVRQAQASLTQALFTWGQVGAAIHGAKEGMAMADDQLDAAGQDAVRDAVEAHCDVLLARELAAIAAHDLELKQRHLDEAQRKLDEGTATDYEVLAARVAVQNARPQAIRAANAVRTARDRLRYLLALEGAEVDAAGELAPGDSLAPPPDYETALAAAWAHRPELAAIAHQRAVQHDLVKIYGAGDKPRLDLQAAYGQREYDIDGFTADGPYWSAGLYVSFPIFDGLRTRGKVAQARSDARAVEIEEARLRDLIALEVRTAVHAVEEARGIEAALAGTVAQARRLLAMAEAGFDLGVKTHLEVEDAQLDLMAARGNLARARRDRAVAEVTLERVQGTLR